jgi:hypothetical protein
MQGWQMEDSAILLKDSSGYCKNQARIQMYRS